MFREWTIDKCSERSEEASDAFGIHDEGLPANPVIPPSYTVWKWLGKPMGLIMAGLGVLVVFFHRVTVGPKLPQPEPVITEHPDEAESDRRETP